MNAGLVCSTVIFIHSQTGNEVLHLVLQNSQKSGGLPDQNRFGQIGMPDLAASDKT